MSHGWQSEWFGGSTMYHNDEGYTTFCHLTWQKDCSFPTGSDKRNIYTKPQSYPLNIRRCPVEFIPKQFTQLQSFPFIYEVYSIKPFLTSAAAAAAAAAVSAGNHVPDRDTPWP